MLPSLKITFPVGRTGARGNSTDRRRERDRLSEDRRIDRTAHRGGRLAWVDLVGKNPFAGTEVRVTRVNCLDLVIPCIERRGAQRGLSVIAERDGAQRLAGILENHFPGGRAHARTASTDGDREGYGLTEHRGAGRSDQHACGCRTSNRLLKRAPAGD